MNISKKSFFVKMAYGHNEIPEGESICDATRKFFIGLIGSCILWLLLVIVMIIDGLYMLISGKSFIVVWWRSPNNKFLLPHLRVPHIWYKGYPIPQMIAYSVLSTWLMYKAVIHLSPVMQNPQQASLIVYTVAVIFSTGIPLIVGWSLYKEDLRQLYTTVWVVTKYTEKTTASAWQVFTAMMQAIKTKTCIKITYV